MSPSGPRSSPRRNCSKLYNYALRLTIPATAKLYSRTLTRSRFRWIKSREVWSSLPSAGAIVGFAAILARGDGDSELDALFVEPSLWRRGYGKGLLQHCVDAARQRSSAALHVVGNPHAEGFYTACGFELVGTEQTRFGTGLLLRKGL